ncbi:MAG: transglutaminase family protein, partial [Phycisphaeraceae bacterium]
MSIRVALHHKTVYSYDRRVQLGAQLVRLRPAPHARTPILGYSMKVEPGDHFVNWQQDPFGNFMARLVFSEKTRELSVEVDLIADMTVINPFDFFVEPDAEAFPFAYEPWLKKELAPYLETEPATPKFAELLAELPRSNERTVDFLVEINGAIYRRLGYVVRMEPGVQTPEETLKLGRGSCRDTSWLLVQILRNLGFAARFVSGYLIQLKPDLVSLDGPPGTDHDFTDLHAWCEVFLPGA